MSHLKAISRRRLSYNCDASHANACHSAESAGRNEDCNGAYQCSCQSSPSRLKLGPFKHEVLSSVRAVTQKRAWSTRCNTSGLSSPSHSLLLRQLGGVHFSSEPPHLFLPPGCPASTRQSPFVSPGLLIFLADPAFVRPPQLELCAARRLAEDGEQTLTQRCDTPMRSKMSDDLSNIWVTSGTQASFHMDCFKLQIWLHHSHSLHQFQHKNALYP